MAAENATPFEATNQVSTADLTPDGAVVGPSKGMQQPSHPERGHAEKSDADRDQPGSNVGAEGELPVWEARYSKKNFLGRILLRVAVTVAWAVMAVSYWGYQNLNMRVPLWFVGVIAVGLWLELAYKIAMAHYGHYYRLTTRRLFISTGVFRRRRDQVELIRIQDVFSQQNLFQRWLSVGDVVVLSSDRAFPKILLMGVDDPKHVMDLIFHNSRAERDTKVVKVEG